MDDISQHEGEIIQIVEHDNKITAKSASKGTSLFAKQFSKHKVQSTDTFPQPFVIEETKKDTIIISPPVVNQSSISMEAQRMLEELTVEQREKEIKEIKEKYSSKLIEKLKKISVKDEYSNATSINNEEELHVNIMGDSRMIGSQNTVVNVTQQNYLNYSLENLENDQKFYSAEETIVLLRSVYNPHYQFGLKLVNLFITTRPNIFHQLYDQLLPSLVLNYKARTTILKIEVLDTIYKLIGIECPHMNIQLTAFKRNYIPYNLLNINNFSIFQIAIDGIIGAVFEDSISSIKLLPYSDTKTILIEKLLGIAICVPLISDKPIPCLEDLIGLCEITDYTFNFLLNLTRLVGREATKPHITKLLSMINIYSLLSECLKSITLKAWTGKYDNRITFLYANRKEPYVISYIESIDPNIIVEFMKATIQIDYDVPCQIYQLLLLFHHIGKYRQLVNDATAKLKIKGKSYYYYKLLNDCKIKAEFQELVGVDLFKMAKLYLNISASIIDKSKSQLEILLFNSYQILCAAQSKTAEIKSIDSIVMLFKTEFVVTSDCFKKLLQAAKVEPQASKVYCGMLEGIKHVCNTPNLLIKPLLNDKHKTEEKIEILRHLIKWDTQFHLFSCYDRAIIIGSSLAYCSDLAFDQTTCQLLLPYISQCIISKLDTSSSILRTSTDQLKQIISDFSNKFVEDSFLVELYCRSFMLLLQIEIWLECTEW